MLDNRDDISLKKGFAIKTHQVLLSFYNGNAFIDQALQALTKQKEVDPHLLIRDDGSIEALFSLLESLLCASGLNWELIKGPNLGACKSFLELLKLSSPGASYYSFCDQDDVWYPDKLIRAQNRLEPFGQNIPAMYFGRLDITNRELETIILSPIPTRPPSFQNALVENIATGATIVINRAARDLLLTKIPENALMHDWWVYLVISALGQVVYDPEPCIKYRLHDSNAIGWKIGFIIQTKARIRRFIKERGFKKVRTQVQEFYSIFGTQLDIEKKTIIEKYLFQRETLFQRLIYCLFNSDLYRQTRFDNFVLRLLILLDRI